MGNVKARENKDVVCECSRNLDVNYMFKSDFKAAAGLRTTEGFHFQEKIRFSFHSPTTESKDYTKNEGELCFRNESVTTSLTPILHNITVYIFSKIPRQIWQQRHHQHQQPHP